MACEKRAVASGASHFGILEPIQIYIYICIYTMCVYKNKERDIKVSRVLWGPGNYWLEILIATAVVGGQKYSSCDFDKPCFPESCTGRGSCGQTGSLFMAAEACNSSALPCLKETKGHKGYLGIYCGNLDD